MARYAIGSLFGLSMLIFGTYLIYDRVVLSIASGHMEETEGIIELAHDPVWFWSSAGMFAIFGAAIMSSGLWYLWVTFRRNHGAAPENPKADRAPFI